MRSHLIDPAAFGRTPPRRVCILRLSAIGDTCHVVPLLRTLQHAWPETRFEVVWDAGHASTEPGVIDALVRATDAAFRL